MLNPVMLLTALLMFAFTPAPAPSPVPQDQAAAAAKSPVKPTAASQADAKRLYGVDCAMCHGDNGNGKTDLATAMQLKLDDWTDPKSLAGKSDQQLFDLIRSGKDKMPPEAAGRAKDNEVWNLIIYIRKMSESQEAAPAKPGN
jgi:cytochrome c5